MNEIFKGILDDDYSISIYRKDKNVVLDIRHQDVNKRICFPKGRPVKVLAFLQDHAFRITLQVSDVNTCLTENVFMKILDYGITMAMWRSSNGYHIEFKNMGVQNITIYPLDRHIYFEECIMEEYNKVLAIEKEYEELK